MRKSIAAVPQGRSSVDPQPLPEQATWQEKQVEASREQSKFEAALREAIEAHAKRSPVGQVIEFYHAQRGQYGKDLFVLMEKPVVDHNKSAEVFWGNPAVDKGTVVITTSSAMLLTTSERVNKPATFVMWKHKWTPTWVKATSEHHVIWPPRER